MKLRNLFKSVAVAALFVLIVGKPAFAQWLPLGGSQSTIGFLAAGHWVAAQLPMTPIFPQSDSITRNYARPHWAFCDNSHAVQDVIPIVVQGGALPYVYTLLSGPPGASIEQNYWVPGDTPAQMYAAGYGNFAWTPQGNVTCPWTGIVSVLVTGQDFVSVTISFTLSTVGSYASSSATANITTNGTTSVTVNSVSVGTLSYGMVLSGFADIPANDYITRISGSTMSLAVPATGTQTGSVTGSLKAGFLFIDSTCTSCDSTGSGTIASPWQTLSKLYGATSCVTSPGSCSTYPGAIAYLRGLNPATDYEAADQGTHPGFTMSGANNPISVIGVPGDPNTPDIDITNLSANVSSKGDVFFPYADASDNFIQGIAFSGVPTSGTANFSYIWVTYPANRLTYDNLSFLNVWPGTSTLSGNSTDIGLDSTSSPFSPRFGVVMRGIIETGRPANYDGVGIYDAYTTTNAVAEFDSFEGSGSGSGSAYGIKDSDTYFTNRYDFSSGQAAWLLWQAGFLESTSVTNDYIENAYDTVVYTGSNPTSPAVIYNQSTSSPSFTLHTFDYRNSIVGTGVGVAQASTSGDGPFWVSSDAIQYGSGLSQGVTFSTDGHTFTGGSLPSNVSNINTACQAPSGIFNGSYQLTGACASDAGLIGATIQ
jgi:hypothetical protein